MIDKKCQDGWCRYESYDSGVAFCRLCMNISPNFVDEKLNKLIENIFEDYKKHLKNYENL